MFAQTPNIFKVAVYNVLYSMYYIRMYIMGKNKYCNILYKFKNIYLEKLTITVYCISLKHIFLEKLQNMYSKFQ